MLRHRAIPGAGIHRNRDSGKSIPSINIVMATPESAACRHNGFIALRFPSGAPEGVRSEKLSVEATGQDSTQVMQPVHSTVLT